MAAALPGLTQALGCRGSFMRYRKPSLKTLLGVTSAKKKIKKDLGIYEVTKILNAPRTPSVA